MQRTRTFIEMFILMIPALAGIQDVKAQTGMAQMLPADGYVVLLSGDTLNGKISWTLKYVENNPVEIRFTDVNEDEELRYHAGEIKGFSTLTINIEEDTDIPPQYQYEFYQTVPSPKKGEPVFMNRLIDGKLSIFQNRSSAQYTKQKSEKITKIDGLAFGFIPGEGLYIGPSYKTSYRIIEERTRFSSYYIMKANTGLIKVDSKNYPGLFDQLFGDCEQIKLEIENNPELKSFKNLMIIAEVYNQLCISYQTP